MEHTALGLKGVGGLSLYDDEGVFSFDFDDLHKGWMTSLEPKTLE